MKKAFLTLLILLLANGLPAISSTDEIIEDYMDIVANNCIIGDYADAVMYLDKVIKLAPGNPEFPKLKNLLYQLGTKNQKSFISGYNENIDKAFNYKLLGERNLEGDILQKATKNGNFWAYSYLGDFYRENKLYDRAVDAYIQAFQMEPSFTQALLAIAMCYYESGQYELVNEPIKRFLYSNQQSDVAYALRAKTYMMQGQLLNAETEIVTALALNKDVEYKLIHGIILYKKGNYNRAIETLNEVATEVQTSDVFKFLGLSYFALKEYSNAMLNLDKAIILSNDDKELNMKYNEIKALIKNINKDKLQTEERAEVKNIYE